MAKITKKPHEITDCGGACLGTISAHYNLQLPIVGIRQYTGTDDWKGIILPSFDLQVSISVDVLTNNEVTKIFGGSYFFSTKLHIAS